MGMKTESIQQLNSHTQLEVQQERAYVHQFLWVVLLVQGAVYNTGV